MDHRINSSLLHEWQQISINDYCIWVLLMIKEFQSYQREVGQQILCRKDVRNGYNLQSKNSWIDPSAKLTKSTEKKHKF